MESSVKYKVIIVDDQPQFRESLRVYLINELGYSVIGEARNGDEFLEMKNINEADIILMDIEMPGMNGLETSKLALWRFSHLKIIAITMYKDKAYLKSLIESGIKGFVHKNNIFAELQKAIKLVYQGRLYFPSDLMLD
jgi:DNA-binding NarL/FixJ family response regulator